MTTTPEQTGDETVTKLRVTMRSSALQPDGNTAVQEAVDYVRPDFLEAYLADARAKWQYVEVSEEPDAGPAGYHGPTHIPAHLNHPDAGTTYEATYPDGQAPDVAPTQAD